MERERKKEKDREDAIVWRFGEVSFEFRLILVTYVL